MAKTKQKAKLKTDIRKSHTIVFIFVLFSLFLLGLVLLQASEKSQLTKSQKDTLNGSQEQLSNVYVEFSKSTDGLVRLDQPNINRCSTIGSKGVHMYNCGNKFKATADTISEKQYALLANKLTEAYESNQNFTDTTSYEPEVLDGGNKISNVSGGSFKGSEIRCYVSSEFLVNTSSANFSGGCHLNTKFLIFAEVN